jgi:drug/metabolite transporter (DMT)-like permease
VYAGRLLDTPISPLLGLLLAGVALLFARWRHREPWGRLALQLLGAAVLGGLPAAYCFHVGSESGEPSTFFLMMELGFLAGTLLGAMAPVVAAAVARRRQYVAFALGSALVGAFVGTGLAFGLFLGTEAQHGITGLDALAVALVGAFAVSGYQAGAGRAFPPA